MNYEYMYNVRYEIWHMAYSILHVGCPVRATLIRPMDLLQSHEVPSVAFQLPASPVSVPLPYSLADAVASAASKYCSANV